MDSKTFAAFNHITWEKAAMIINNPYYINLYLFVIQITNL